MKHLNNNSVLNSENQSFNAETEAFKIAIGLTGVPNPNWTQGEWEAIFSNLIDVLKDKVDRRMRYKQGHKYYTNVGSAVVQTIIHGCGYNGTELINDKVKGKDTTIIHVW